MKVGNVLFNDAINIFYFTVIWRWTTQIVKEETRCRHMGYYFRLASMFRSYAPSNRQDSTYHGICYTSRGPQAGRRKIKVGRTYRGKINKSLDANLKRGSYRGLSLRYCKESRRMT